MDKVKWDKNGYGGKDKLPAGWAFFSLLQGGKTLLCGYTPNLSQRVANLKLKSEQEALYAQLVESADTLEFEAYPRALDALLRCKVEIQIRHPQYQNALNPASDYVYLALNARRFPFVSVQSHTNDDWLYLGPWRSRFFLADVIDSVSRILKIPFCETGTFPCEKLDRGICRGYCLALSDDSESGEKPDLDKLDALLKEAFLHPENGILDLVCQQRNAYFDELEFEKADLLDDEIEILANYKDWLTFLYAAKALNFATDEIRVEGGMLTWCRFEGSEHNFPIIKTEYRDNEKLALNLADVDEARIIYDHYTKQFKG